MFGGLGGMDPKKMQAMMSKMGIKQDEVEATRVIIEKADGNIVIENPNVVKITMQGNESWQITGKAREEAGLGINSEDIRLIIEQTGASESEARRALEKAGGDLARAIASFN